MTSDLDCRCARADRPCRRRMTQEDTLCDPCRAGCGSGEVGAMVFAHCQVFVAPATGSYEFRPGRPPQRIG